MTTKPAAHPRVKPGFQYPERPESERNMQNSIHLDFPGYQPALYFHFGASDDLLVVSECALVYPIGDRNVRLYPDLLIAFGVDAPSAIAQLGYSIEEQGKPPDFVMEIASEHTAQNDYTHKRLRYAEFGVPEYWRFDPTGGQRYPAPLAGDLLVDGEYRPIPITQTGENRYWGHSAALNLDLCWEDGKLRWYDPATGSYILTHEDEREGRIAERDARIAEQEARIIEREGRIAERDARIAEQEARIAERDARIAAEARVRELEEELRRRAE